MTCTHSYNHSQNRITFPTGYTKHNWSSLVVLEESGRSSSTTLTNSPPSTNFVSPSTLISCTTSVRAAFLSTNWTIRMFFRVKTKINIFTPVILWMHTTLFFAFVCSWIYICRSWKYYMVNSQFQLYEKYLKLWNIFDVPAHFKLGSVQFCSLLTTLSDSSKVVVVETKVVVDSDNKGRNPLEHFLATLVIFGSLSSAWTLLKILFLNELIFLSLTKNVIWHFIRYQLMLMKLYHWNYFYYDFNETLFYLNASTHFQDCRRIQPHFF